MASIILAWCCLFTTFEMHSFVISKYLRAAKVLLGLLSHSGMMFLLDVTFSGEWPIQRLTTTDIQYCHGNFSRYRSDIWGMTQISLLPRWLHNYCIIISAVTILKSKIVGIFCQNWPKSKSLSLLSHCYDFFAAINGCYWIKWLYFCCYCCCYARWWKL